MKKKFISVALFGALMAASTSVVTSCQDYDDDIGSLNTRVTENETSWDSQSTALQEALTAAQSAIETAEQNIAEANKAIEEARKAGDDAAADAAAAGLHCCNRRIAQHHRDPCQVTGGDVRVLHKELLTARSRRLKGSALFRCEHQRVEDPFHLTASCVRRKGNGGRFSFIIPRRTPSGQMAVSVESQLLCC